MLLRESHDRHAAHRVPDEDERAGWRHGFDDVPEVSSELIDMVRVELRATRAAVTSLVIGDETGATVELLALEVPGVQAQGVAVREDDRDPRSPWIVRLIDLDVQQCAVLGWQFEDLGIEAFEFPLVIAPRRARHERPLRSRSQRRACGEGASCQQPGSRNLQCAREVIAHGAPT